MYSSKKENILLILHELQSKSDYNYLSENDLLFVSHYLNLSYGFVYGVATYYGMFSLVSRGKYIIKLCKSPVCSMLGSIVLFDFLHDFLNLKNKLTTDDGMFTLETVECLGHCEKSPCMLVNKTLHGNLTINKTKKIITNYKNRNFV